jgi:H(+)-translocating pyrophosphatase
MGGPNARFAARGAVVHSTGCKNFLVVCGVVALVVLALVTEAVEALESLLVLSLCLGALAFALIQTLKLLDKDTGTQRMQEVAGFIHQGAQGFFRTQYSAIAAIAVVVAVMLFIGFVSRPVPIENAGISPFSLAVITTTAFLVGCVCSCFAGYVGLWISVRTNVRVASAARRSYMEAIQVAMQGGIIAAIVVVALVVAGILVLYLVFEEVFVGAKNVVGHANEVPILLVGYGFGASFVALFAQLGGGIYTKAADVGADLVGKVEAGIPEDDPRNPAVIAALAGDNVGDCAGRGADLFESIAAEIISAMILGGTMATQAGIEGTGFVMFPLVIHAFDLVVSSFGYFMVSNRGRGGLHDGASELGSPLDVLKRGFYMAGLLSLGTFTFACKWLLATDKAPDAWWHFLVCGVVGMVSGYLSVAITTYYTSTEYRPVQDIGRASTSGDATNIIMGVAVGMESTGLPILVVSAAILVSYWMGESSGLLDADKQPIGGLFGTAVATMGMLSTAVYVLGMDFFGPIADNAGGIVEMSEQPARVRDITDELDAVGNTTKAATKGFAVCSATLASFLLFSAFEDEVSAMRGGEPVGPIDIATPEIFVAGMLGAMLIFYFTSMTLRAVGDTAAEVVVEVRRQFEACPGILTGEEQPDYKACVAIVARASLRKMVKPGLLVVCFPVLVGVAFRAVGDYQGGDPLLGAKAVSSFLMFATVSGVLCSLFMNNAGGAWDNAKKLIESGAYGGKGSDAHKAAVTGDTVGDPFKDTSGPSLHVVIKLLATITLVAAPLFVTVSSAKAGAEHTVVAGTAP